MAVQTIDDLDNFFKENKDAMSNETFFEEISRLEFDYSNEIPKQIIHSTDPNPPHYSGWKVRTAWFLQIMNLTQAALFDGLVPEDLVDRVNEFADFVVNKKSEITQKEDIDYADKLLKDLRIALSDRIKRE